MQAIQGALAICLGKRKHEDGERLSARDLSEEERASREAG